MKNKRFLVVLISLMLVCGFVMVGCDNGTTNDETKGNPFVGTWEQNSGKAPAKFVITNTTWVFYYDNEYTKGTYTYEGKIATFVTTEEWDDENWTEFDDPEVAIFKFSLSEDEKEMTSIVQEFGTYKRL
jgi:hypothetical protein